MTVYWLDPFIDAPVNGIHGTTDTSTRSGTYAAPWSLADVCGTSHNGSTINGTNLTSSDEVRIKGQALSSYYYNLSGVSDNLIPITGAERAANSNPYFTFNGSTYQTAVDAHIADTNTGNSLMMIIHDPALKGSHQWSPAQTRSSATSWADGYIEFDNNNYMSHGGYVISKYGITSSNNMKFAFIDPNYIFDFVTTFSGTRYLLVFSNSFEITDGWDSETTQNGVTLLTFNCNTSNRTVYMFNQQNHSAPAKYNLPNTFFFYCNKDSYYTGTKRDVHFKKFGAGGTSNSFAYIGGLCGNHSNAWNYHRFDASENLSDATASIKIGLYTGGRYNYFYKSNTKSGTYEIDNYIAGQAPYAPMNQSGTDTTLTLKFGHVVVYEAYSASYGLIGTVNSTVVNFEFLANSHVYGHRYALALTDTRATVTVPSTVTNFQDQPTDFPSTGSYATVADTGPVFKTFKVPSLYFIDTSATGIKLSPSAWYEGSGIQAAGNTSILSYSGAGIHTHDFGELDVGSSTYIGQDSKLMVKPSIYSLGFFSRGQNYTFATNTYDQKPIRLWVGETQTSTSYMRALISWNDSSGNIVVNDCTDHSSTTSVNYSNIFVTERPASWTTGDATFSMEIEINSGFTPSQVPELIVFRQTDDANYLRSYGSLSGTTYSFSQTLVAANFDPDVKFIAYKIVLTNDNTNGSASNTWTVKPPTITT